MEGKPKGESYKEAFGRPDLETNDACRRATPILKKPAAKAALNRLSTEIEKEAIALSAQHAKDTRSREIKKTLLTLNDRLSILAGIAQSKTSKPGEKARAIEVYSKIAGDFAPQRMEITGADGGPIQQENRIDITSIPIRDRIARIRGMQNVTPLDRQSVDQGDHLRAPLPPVAEPPIQQALPPPTTNEPTTSANP